MLDIKVGTTVQLYDRRIRSVNYIDLRPSYCGLCKRPFTAIRLLMEDGVLTLCRDDHATFNGYMYIQSLCRAYPLRINLRNN